MHLVCKFAFLDAYLRLKSWSISNFPALREVLLGSFIISLILPEHASPRIKIDDLEDKYCSYPGVILKTTTTKLNTRFFSANNTAM